MFAAAQAGKDDFKKFVKHFERLANIQPVGATGTDLLKRLGLKPDG